jgi:hypothetical protein
MKTNKLTPYIAFFLVMMLGAFEMQAQTAKIQIVHNSPDYIIDTVDVWANDVKIANDLVFRKSTLSLTIDSGDYVITVSKKFSTDSSALFSLLKVEGFRVDTSKTYLAFISGVVDTSMYASNPNGVDHSLSFVSSEVSRLAATNQIDLSFFNGTPDASQWDLNEIGLPGLVKIGDDIAYGSFSPITALASSNSMFNIASADSSIIVGAYRFNATGLSTKVACIFSSGVMDTISNPNQAALNKFYVVLNTGAVLPLVLLTRDIQIIHNSADLANDSLDLYINGSLVWDNMAFREATVFLKQKALESGSIAFAPKSSISVADAFNTLTIPVSVDSSTNYYFIASGLTGNGYEVNPNGKSTAFSISQYKGARKNALIAKNVDLLYFHGVTDLQATTCRAEGQVQFLSKDDTYGGFHGYGAHTAQDNLKTDLKDAVTGNTLYTGFLNLAAHQGQAGLAFSSGFLNANDTTNQNGDTLIMFVVWPDGDVDSIAPTKPNTGLFENRIVAKNIELYPNPADELFAINFDAANRSTMTVTVKDIMGKTIQLSNHKTTLGTNNIVINSSDFNAGVYFVTLSTNGESITKKVSVLK